MAADGSGLLDTAGAEPLAVIGFAGGGGSSKGYKLATGRDPSLAANHWLTAVLAHQRHFPATEHYCADIYDVDPESWRPHEPIRFGWFSPDCTDHSKAKGSAPKTERIRGLGWSVIPWAKTRQVQTIMVENVEEYVQWGPVYRTPDDWRSNCAPGQLRQPIKALRGVTFRLWKRRLAQAGYWVEHRELNAADYGAATTRVRFYCIAEYVGVERVTRIALGLEPSPITWPEPTHAPRHKAEALGRRPWRGFCEVADWSQPCPSIFLTKAECDELRRTTGRRVQRPLVKATQKRIARGLERYVIAAAEPFIVPITHAGDSRTHGVRDPLKTVTAAKGGEFAFVSPGLVGLGGRRAQSPPVDVRNPAPTLTGKADAAVVAASLAQLAHGDHPRGPGTRVRDLRDPLNTISAGGGDGAIIAGSLVRTNFHSAAARNGVRDAGEPLGTVTGDGGFGFAGAYLVRQFGSAVGGRDVAAPLGATLSGGARGGGHDQFVAAYMAQGNFDDLGRGCCEPVTTVTGRATQQQLVSACLDTYYRTTAGADCGDPMPTATAKDRVSLIGAWLEQANTGMIGHAAGDPVSTIVGKGCTQRLVEARLELDGGSIGRRAQVLEFLWSHFGMPTAAEWADPTGTLEARKKFGLVVLPTRSERIGNAEGVTAEMPAHDVWMIVDIGLRMLTTGELCAAMGAEDLSLDVHGRPITKTAQTEMIGNMVHPDPCAALIRAQCPDLIPENLQEAA